MGVGGATYLGKAWDADEYAELAANEYFCMRVVAKTGLPVARCELSNNGRLLVVERFDLDERGQSCKDCRCQPRSARLRQRTARC